MSKITYTHLRDICVVNQGLQIPIEERFKEPKENRYFYITVQFLKDSYLEKYYVENPNKSTICEEDDILVVRTGNTGQIITGIKGCFHNNFFKVNFDKNKLNSKYLYYCLTTKEKQYEMAKRAGITTIPDLNHFMFLDMQIPLQEKENQDKIVQILDSLNSKIEINNKINKELESMAKTLYDYWFVQFDFPDENGQPYKSSGGKMIYNQELKRDIPEGWGVKTLDTITNIIAGGDKPKDFSEYQTSELSIPIYSNGIENEGLYGFTNNARINNPSITISARGTLGYCCLRFKPYLPIVRLISVTPKIQNQIVFFYQAIKNLVFENSGSVQQQLTVPQVSELKIVLPPEFYLTKFEKIGILLFSKIENIKQQNQELAKLRDWLLPMLMNGQVKVK